MSETKPDEQNKEAEKPISQPVAWGSLTSVVLGLVSAALGASWAGVAALGGLGLVIGLGLPLIYSKLIGEWNARIDGRDQANAGADAGNTAVDLSNQGHDVRVGLDDLSRLDPPKKPSQN